MDLDKLKIDRSAAPKRRARRRGFLGPLVALGVVAALLWLFRAPLLRAVDRVTLLEVQVLTVTRTTNLASASVSGTTANGYVVASKRAALSADTPGRVVELNVVEGSVVREGDVVARLYSEEFEAALKRAEAQVDAERAALARTAADLEVAGREVERRIAEVEAAKRRGDAAQAVLELAEKELERRQELVAEGVEGQSQLDAAESAAVEARANLSAERANVTAAVAGLREAESRQASSDAARKEALAQIAVAEATALEARATLEKTYVRAPFDGVVVLKDAEVGEVVSPNSQGGNSRGSVATLVDLASLEVQIDLPENLLRNVEVAAPATVFLDAYPDQPYTGRVLRIWPTANRQKATVEIRVGFDAPDEKLRPDMGARVVFGRVEDPVPEPEAGPQGGRILIPSEAIVRISNLPGVFRLERDVVRWQVLEVGESNQGRTEVLTGLEGGERVVAQPPPELTDGDRVRIASS